MTETVEHPTPGWVKGDTVDWRSDREKAGYCRCGVFCLLPSPGCEWHAAVAHRYEFWEAALS